MSFLVGDPFLDNLFVKYVKSLDDVNITVKNAFPNASGNRDLKLWAYTISCRYFNSFEEIINHESFNDNEKSLVILFPYNTIGHKFRYLNAVETLTYLIQYKLQFDGNFEINRFSEEDFSKWITTLAIKNNNSEEIIKLMTDELCFRTLNQANKFLIPLYKISSQKDEIQNIKVKIYGTIFDKTILFSDLLKKYD